MVHSAARNNERGKTNVFANIKYSKNKKQMCRRSSPPLRIDDACSKNRVSEKAKISNASGQSMYV